MLSSCVSATVHQSGIQFVVTTQALLCRLCSFLSMLMWQHSLSIAYTWVHLCQSLTRWWTRPPGLICSELKADRQEAICYLKRICFLVPFLSNLASWVAFWKESKWLFSHEFCLHVYLSSLTVYICVHLRQDRSTRSLQDFGTTYVNLTTAQTSVDSTWLDFAKFCSGCLGPYVCAHLVAQWKADASIMCICHLCIASLSLTWYCQYSFLHVEYWLPLELGAVLVKFIALPLPQLSAFLLNHFSFQFTFMLVYNRTEVHEPCRTLGPHLLTWRLLKLWWTRPGSTLPCFVKGCFGAFFFALISLHWDQPLRQLCAFAIWARLFFNDLVLAVLPPRLWCTGCLLN